ncbi:MAG TPA: hypothetical protein VEK39_15355 [Solirubrobacterales bacterium]|nr:hypothetical protein [Solirubrobacterales bacterium]
MRKRRAGRFRALPLALLLVMLLPAIARAETHTFLNTADLYPSGGAGDVGPANHYPSTIVVAGLSGTVTKATVTLIGYRSASPDDTDMVITGPNGQQVMLMSDVCGSTGIQNDNWTFDDSAQTFMSNNGPCANYEEASFKPSNYLGNIPEPDDLSPGGGPSPPYVNAMSFFNGASPNGAWSLFVMDDSAGFSGFDIAAWALTLEVQPPSAGDTAPPETTITKGPKDKTKKKTATFEFSSSEPGSTFQCSLDGGAFESCSSPHEVKVKKGKHSFAVRAQDGAGNLDPTPATSSWKVKQKH